MLSDLVGRGSSSRGRVLAQRCGHGQLTTCVLVTRTALRATASSVRTAGEQAASVAARRGMEEGAVDQLLRGAAPRSHTLAVRETARSSLVHRPTSQTAIIFSNLVGRGSSTTDRVLAQRRVMGQPSRAEHHVVMAEATDRQHADRVKTWRIGHDTSCRTISPRLLEGTAMCSQVQSP